MAIKSCKFFDKFQVCIILILTIALNVIINTDKLGKENETFLLMSTLASHWIYAVIYIQQNRLVLANKLLQILYNTDKYWPNLVILSDLWKISWCLPFSPSAFFTGQTEKDWFGQNQYLPFKFDKCVGYVKMGSRNMKYHMKKEVKHMFYIKIISRPVMIISDIYFKRTST